MIHDFLYKNELIFHSGTWWTLLQKWVKIANVIKKLFHKKIELTVHSITLGTFPKFFAKMNSLFHEVSQNKNKNEFIVSWS
jgi:hypothetical protein